MVPSGDLLFLAEAKLSGFWQLIVDEKKQIFTSEKFLLLASEDGALLPLRGLKAGAASLSLEGPQRRLLPDCLL